MKTRLIELWRRRDELRNQDVAVAWMPHDWKRLQEELLRAEEHWQAGFLDAADRHLKIAEDGLNRIQADSVWKMLDENGAWSDLSLSWGKLAGRGTVLKEEQKAQFVQLAQEMISRSKPAESGGASSTGATPNQAGAASVELPNLDAPEGKAFAEWIVEQASNETAELKFAEIAAVLEEGKRKWPAGKWPVELVMARELSHAAASASGEQNAALFRQLFQIHTGWYDLLGEVRLHEAVAPRVHEKLKSVGHALLAAQRWLAIGAAGRTFGEEALQGEKRAQRGPT